MKIAEIKNTQNNDTYCVYYESGYVKAFIDGEHHLILGSKLFYSSDEAKKALKEDFEKSPRQGMILIMEDIA